MVKTVNRQPYNVAQLKYSDIKYKYFTHNEWKGVCDDKNYLSIDQFTFADSNNVYVDAEGILKSRPSVKLRKDGPYGTHIVNVFNFGNFTVYHKQIGTTNTLLFFTMKNGTETPMTIENYPNGIPVVGKFNLVYTDNKIYIFNDGKISYLDTTPDPIYGTNYFYTANAQLKVYVPITEVITGNAVVKNESKNVLTSSYISRYLYDSSIQLNSPKLYNKTVDITVGDYTKSYWNFQQNSEQTIVEECNTLPDNCTENGNYLFWANDTGITMYAQKITSDGTKNLYNLFYSLNGRFYKQLPYLADTIGYPALSTSTDHVFAVLFKEDGAYAYTLGGKAINEGTRIAYTTWTKLSSTTDKLVRPQGDFLDETAFAYVDVIADSNNGTLYTCKNSNVIKHNNYTLSYNDYGNLSILCTPSVTSIYSIYDGWYLFYNDEADVAIDNVTDILPAAASRSNKLCKSMLKQRYLLGTISVACIGSTVDIHSVFLTEEDIASHITDIPETQIYKRSINISGYEMVGNTDNYRLEMSTNQSIITNQFLIIGETVTPVWRKGMVPIGYAANNYFVIEDNKIYTNEITSLVYIDLKNEGELNIIDYDYETELEEFYIAKGNKLYISATGQNLEPGEFKWYFPEISIQTFDYDITNLHPISTSEVAVFFKDSIYYVNKSTATINGIEQTVYSYYKSRIPLGCEEGSDVITSYDNKYTMFVTKRGFVAMAYQDFISSQEQALTFLSDEIFDLFNEWNNGPIKLFQYNFWIILYKPLNAKSFVFDMRSNSWWPIEYNNSGLKLIELNRKPILVNSNGYLYAFDTSNDNYYDGNSLEDGRINWHITSQKLHLDAINYYKHIVNLTLFGYNYGSEDALMKFNLRVINYRKQTDTNETKSFESVEYKIQLTRTFVKRINYYKVNQMQYVIESCRDIDEYDEHPIPLSLTCISIKYLVTGQVR